MRYFSALILVATGCTAPDLDAMFTQVDVTAGDQSDAEAAAVELINGAQDSLRLSLPAAQQDGEMVEALVNAYNMGVDVEVVTDFDELAGDGIQRLINEDIPVSVTNDGLEYFEFVLTTDIAWSSDQTVLSTSFIVADAARFVSSNDLGFNSDGARIIVTGQGEDLCDDLLKEHNQLMGYGGESADSVSTTAFDSSAKSIADVRWRYPLGTGTQVELWFGPQERVTKRIIDAVYSAKSDIRVLTDEFANEGLTKALQDKADLGFDVEVIVGPRWGETSSALARLLRSNTPDVSKRQVTTGRVPTIVLIDLDVARDGEVYPAKAFVLSHDLYSAERLYRGSPVFTDQLIDGVLWVIEDNNNGGTPQDVADELIPLVETYESYRATAEGL
ncbi:MAG: hypothetical protein AB8H79_17695 [Myxococcota bacterium]